LPAELFFTDLKTALLFPELRKLKDSPKPWLSYPKFFLLEKSKNNISITGDWIYEERFDPPDF